MLRCSATRAMTRTLHEPWPKPKRPPSARDPPSQSAAPPQKTAESISRKPYNAQGRGALPDGLGPVVGRAVPEHDQRLIGELGPQPAQHLDRVFAVGAREGPQPHLALVVQVHPIE